MTEQSTGLSSAWQVYPPLDGSETRCRMNCIKLNNAIRFIPIVGIACCDWLVHLAYVLGD